ncbi:hypothetical protein TruAng_011416 [Truncatella angustata]|nr:hypothetical protein TruAng_011416 [Truncatella angustata]
MEGPPAFMPLLNAPPYDVFQTEEPPDPWDTPLSMIIRRDDLDALAEYLSMHPYRLKGPGACQDHHGIFFPDAFEYAATWGATKVLRSLRHYETRHPEQDFRWGAKEYGLLNLACHHGQLETVRYLLDASHDVAGDLAFRDGDGWTPLLAAADAMTDRSKYQKYHGGLDVASYTSRCEEIMTLLLDKGAPADHVRERQFMHYDGQIHELKRRIRWCEDNMDGEIPESPEYDVTPDGEVITCITDTVLSLAMRRAGAATIQRLLDGGADIHLRLTPPRSDKPLYTPFNTCLYTPLHVAARYFNATAIGVLCDRYGIVEFKKMLKCQDAWGHSTLHIATRGCDFMLPADQILPQGVATFSALLRSCNANDVDTRALQSAMLSDFLIHHKPTRQALRARVARMLVEQGARPASKTSDGGTALHALARQFPVTDDDQCAEAALVGLFLSHSASIDDADNSGNTALHVAVGTYPKLVAARALLRHGARPDVLNKAGDTPLHVAAVMTPSLRNEDLTFQQAAKMQDEVMQLIAEAATSHGGNLMEMRNASGKTPPELRDESRKKVKEYLASLIRPHFPFGRGGGRGRGIGPGNGTGPGDGIGPRDGREIGIGIGRGQ